jgi:hypothetical protein
MRACPLISPIAAAVFQLRFKILRTVASSHVLKLFTVCFAEYPLKGPPNMFIASGII